MIKALNREPATKLVFLTVASLVLQSLQSKWKAGLKNLATELEQLFQCYKDIVLQWIPGHSDIQGNEIADKLEKEGAMYSQFQPSLSLEEIKTLPKVFVLV